MNKIDEQVETLKGLIAEVDAVGLEVATSYTLADAIREGASVSPGQAYDWSDSMGNTCALSAAVVAAKARGYM